MTAALRRPFGSLAIPNYRRYFTGQVISLSGTWMQTVAEVWLILRLTGSGTMVGVAAALQFLPILLAGAWGGLLADRVPKRRLLTITQSLMAIPAFTMWVLSGTGVVEAWMVLALIFVRGAVNAVDNPARQSFVVEMVGRGRLVNAVSLNSVIVQTARIAGPAGAGAMIAVAGVTPCFLLNGLTFVAMLVALRRMDPAELAPAPRANRDRGQLRSALRHVIATPALRIPLAMMAIVGTLSFNFQVLLPLLAKLTWDGNASAYAALTAAMAIGSVGGALASGARGHVSPRLLTIAAGGFGALMLLAAAAPTFQIQLLSLLPLGAMSVTFAAGVNSALQLAVTPEMRGRVMALYSVVFLGSTPIGGPLTGWLSEAAGPRAGLVLGGVAAIAAGLLAHRAFARSGIVRLGRPVPADAPAAAGAGLVAAVAEVPIAEPALAERPLAEAAVAEPLPVEHGLADGGRVAATPGRAAHHAPAPERRAGGASRRGRTAARREVRRRARLGRSAR